MKIASSTNKAVLLAFLIKKAGGTMITISDKKVASDTSYRTISLRMRKELADKVDDLVRATGRSRSNVISILLSEVLEHVTVDEAAQS